MIEPKDPNQSLGIANSLREGVPVIVNLRHLDSDEAKRLFDFICGTIYAIDGHYKKLGDSILLFTPGNVNIVEDSPEAESSDVTAELPSRGMR